MRRAIRVSPVPMESPGENYFSQENTPSGREMTALLQGLFLPPASVTTFLSVQSLGVAHMTHAAQGDLPGKEGLGL